MPFTTLRTFTNQAPEQNIAPGDSEFVSLSGSAIEISIKNLVLSGFSRDAYLRVWRLLDSEKQIIAEYPITQSDADKRELIEGLSSSSSYFVQFASSSPAVRLSGVALAREAPLGTGGGGGGSGASQSEVEAAIEAATFADTGLDAIDTDTEALSADPTTNTAGTATTAQRPTFFLRWLTRLIQPIASSFVASGSTDSGRSVKIGGVYRATPPTLTDGQRGDALLSTRSQLLVDYLDLVSTPNNIQSADSASSTVAGQNNQTIITGNPTNNSTAALVCSGNSSFAALVTGTWVGTLQFERSLDNGTTWTPVGAFSAGTQFIGAVITANGAFHGNCSSSTNIRVRATAWTSGVASVRLLAGQGTGTITVGNAIRLIDLISGALMTIKAASILPSSTDTAIVTTIRDGVGGFTERVAVTPTLTTRTAYSIYDAVGANFTLSNVVRVSGGSGMIGSITLSEVMGASAYSNQAVTATSATPAVFTLNAHTLVNGNAVTIGGTPPTGFTAGTVYWVVASATNTFQLAASPGGAALASSSAGTSVTITEVAACLDVALCLYRGSLTAVTDNAQFSPSATDEATAIYPISLAGTWVRKPRHAQAGLDNVGRAFKATTANLNGVLMTTSSDTKALSANATLELVVNILQD